MIVLGINEDHNASAALVVDGRVVACASEERFTRAKNDVGYPYKAIEYILREVAIAPKDLDGIVYAGYVQDPLQLKIKRVTRYKITDYVREMHEYWKPVLLEGRPSSYWTEVRQDPRLGDPQNVHYDFGFLDRVPPEKWGEAFQGERKQVVSRHLRICPDKICFVDHHTAHAHYAFFAALVDRSERTAVVTADGWGDGCNATVSVAQGDSIVEVHRTANCHLARFYRWITLILGLKPNEHEYKVMGLAPYAKDYIKRPAYNILRNTLVVDGMDFRWKERPPDTYFYFKDRFEREGIRFDGIAGGLQDWLEEMLVEWIGNVLKELQVDQVVFSGGVAMNVKANKAIGEIPQVRNLYVAGSGGDESLCIGAAFVVAKAVDEIQPLSHMYFGPSLSEREVEEVLSVGSVGERYRVMRRPSPNDIAELLSRGLVIARCVGPMEFGARALGNRSILCDPSRWENVRKINEMVKSRDFWMPFAPTILSDREGDYLINPKHLCSPFMTMAFDSTPLAGRHLSAALHPYDFTARPQVLTRETNPDYFAIIKAFEARTGIGAVLNTSFNLHGEPIVCNARDAMHTFAESGLDGLLLPGSLLLKRT